MRYFIEHGLGQRSSQSPGYNKWKPGDENLDWIQYQVGSKTNKSLKWDFTGCSERRTESKTIVRLMEVWIRIKPEEETKMLLQNTKVILRWIMWPSSSMEACSEPSIRSKLSKFWQKWFCNYNFLIFCLNSKDEIDEIRKKNIYVMAQPKSIISSLVIFLQMWPIH